MQSSRSATPNDFRAPGLSLQQRTAWKVLLRAAALEKSVAAVVSRRCPPCLIECGVALQARRPRVDVGIVIGDLGGFESTTG